MANARVVRCRISRRAVLLFPLVVERATQQVCTRHIGEQQPRTGGAGGARTAFTCGGTRRATRRRSPRARRTTPRCRQSSWCMPSTMRKGPTSERRSETKPHRRGWRCFQRLTRTSCTRSRGLQRVVVGVSTLTSPLAWGKRTDSISPSTLRHECTTSCLWPRFWRRSPRPDNGLDDSLAAPNSSTQ